jgi:uncharacterized membrane protein YfcA
MILGILVSFSFQGKIDSLFLKKIFGYFIIFVAIFEIIKMKMKIKLNKHISNLFSLMAGIVHGLLTTGGPLVVLVANSLINNKRQIRNTLSAVWACMSTFMMCLYFWQEKMSFELLKESIFLLPSIPIGIYLGEKILNKISDVQFKIIVLIILVGMSVSFIFKSA